MKRVDIPVVLEFGDRTVEASAAVPDCPMRPADLLPVLLGFTEAMAAVAAESAVSEGRTVSCKAGCGACCRQLVPVSEAEAIYLAELIQQMPPERRDTVRARFSEALKALGEPLVSRLRDTASLRTMESRREAGAEYFARGVACPFLEAESCSIHQHRPAACREYLVTSPAENCRQPGPDTIEMVRLPLKPSVILYCFADGIGNETTRWVPLVLALEWAEAQKGKPQPAYDAPQMFRNFIAQAKKMAERSAAG